MSFYSNHQPETIEEANAVAVDEPRLRTARKPRPKPARRIRVIEQPTPDTDGWGAIAITVGKQTDTYLLRTIPTQFDGTVAFEVEKLDQDLAAVEQYHISLANEPQVSTCECKGFLRWGRCKHLDGLWMLTSTGRI